MRWKQEEFNMSLQMTEKECAEHAIAPRVSLADMEAAIVGRFDVMADEAVQTVAVGELASLKLFSICVLVMRNGFVVIGKSAPASADNFNPELGKKLAYEDAVRQLWPLMGYALRDMLYQRDADERLSKQGA
jgi:hypothetical protein